MLFTESSMARPGRGVSSAGRGPETQLQLEQSKAQWYGHLEKPRGICTWALVTEPPVV